MLYKITTFEILFSFVYLNLNEVWLVGNVASNSNLMPLCIPRMAEDFDTLVTKSRFLLIFKSKTLSVFCSKVLGLVVEMKSRNSEPFVL